MLILLEFRLRTQESGVGMGSNPAFIRNDILRLLIPTPLSQQPCEPRVCPPSCVFPDRFPGSAQILPLPASLHPPLQLKKSVRNRSRRDTTPPAPSKPRNREA